MNKFLVFTCFIFTIQLIIGQRKHWTNDLGEKCKKGKATRFYTIKREKTSNLFLKEYYLYDKKTPYEITHFKTKKCIIKQGESKTFYSNGNLKEQGNFSNNTKEGEWELYDKSGIKYRTTNYVEGIKNGETISFHKNGNTSKVDEYLQGELISSKVFDLEGQEIIEFDDSACIYITEQQPMFPGGTNELLAFLNKNIIYPKYAMEKGIQGRALIEFTVEKDGSITNVKSAYPPGYKREVHRSLVNEAIRVIETMPNWIPGKLKGKPTKSIYRMPVTFRIH